MTILIRIKQRVTDAYQFMVRTARELWQRLIHEPEYAQAAADLAACAITFWCLTFCCQSQHFARIVTALAAPLGRIVHQRDDQDPYSELEAWA